MKQTPFDDVPRVGLDDNNPPPLAGDVAQSVLRLYATDAPLQTHFDAPVLTTPNGGGLYVKSAFYF